MNKPKLFDLVKAWNDDKNDFVVGCHLGMDWKNRKWHSVDANEPGGKLYKHAVKIPHELAEQLRGLDNE